MKKALIVCVLIGLVAGCVPQKKGIVTQPDIIPLNQRLASLPQDWKDAYGDTLEVQLVLTLTILRQNQMEIANVINLLHPTDVNDPNNLKARIEKLEATTIKEYDTVRFGEYGTDNYWGYSIGQIRKVDPNNLLPDPNWLKEYKESLDRQLERFDNLTIK